MAERLRSTGRKSNSAPALGRPARGGCAAAPTSATMSQARRALAAAAKKAACQPATLGEQVGAGERERAGDADARRVAG